MQLAADYSETLEVVCLMSTDGISGHLYVSQSVVCEMATVQERALCGMVFETKSVTETQRNYRTQFNKQPPSDCNMHAPKTHMFLGSTYAIVRK
jgi:hypothetical protein